MRKKHWYTLFVILLVVCILCGCDKSTKKENNHTIEESETGGVPIDPDKHTDFSEVRDDLNRLEEDEITEIYIYWKNKEYSTTDKEIIRQIKEQLLTMEMEETRFEKKSVAEMLPGDGYNLQLCSHDKIYYVFKLLETEFYCGHGQYILISDEGFVEALNIARRTFWRD